MANTKNNKNKAPLGLLFWIAFILLILVFFFAQKDVIIPLFQKFSTEVSNSSEIEKQEELPLPHDEINGSDGSISSKENKNNENTSTFITDKIDTEIQMQEKNAETEKKADTSENKDKKEVEGQTSKKTETQEIIKETQKTRTTVIYFVNIDDSGTIIRYKTARELKKDDSPLTASINALITGPSSEELNTGLISLIPTGTKLLSASVKNGTAVLNFNDAFQFNTRGIEGCRGQLMQIVYTATEFSTVQNVQFLIEGQRKEFLGTEGIRLGVPFSRSSF